jgi:hypothetical protein
MKKWIVAAALLSLAAGTAAADVSNEVIIGLEGDRSYEVVRSTGGTATDISGSYETGNSLFIVRYTRFLDPLKDDAAPVGLRRFLQHPSTLSAGVIAIGRTVDDAGLLSRREDTLGVRMIVLGGEYFFPTNTGLFLNLGSGSGTFEQNVNGVTQSDADVTARRFEFGARQYLTPNAELHLALAGESMKREQGGSEMSQKKSVAMLGVQGVITDMVGLAFEFGGGKRTDSSTGSPDEDFDVGRIDFAITAYAGKQLSFELAAEAEVAERTGLPSNQDYTESTARTTLSAAYWFSERFGMQLSIYREKHETKDVVSFPETKLTERNRGAGLSAGFRF